MERGEGDRGAAEKATGPPYVGIDFGTSKSAVAWYDPRTGRAEILKNAEEQDSTPSAVYFGNGAPIVGQTALNILEDGEEAGDAVEAQQVWINVKRDLETASPRMIGDHLIQPLAVATAIFGKLKADAEEYHFHQRVTRAVITCPASFDVVQRDKILEAARGAGFEEVVLLDEPIAAAIAYAETGLQVGNRVLVYDLGGGTFDVAVLNRDADGTFRIAMAPQGMPDCGGNAFDLALYGYCQEQVSAQHMSEGAEDALPGQDTPVGQPFVQRCRECKEALSSKDSAMVSTYLPVNGRLQRFRQAIERATLEELIAEKVQATVRLTVEMERQAGQAGTPIDTVVLVGSSSKIPLVSRLLGETLSVAPRKWQKQGIAVALGAAYYAHTLWGEDGADRRLRNSEESRLTGEHPSSSLERYRGVLQRTVEKTAENWGMMAVPQLRAAMRKLGLDLSEAEVVEREVLGETVADRAQRETQDDTGTAETGLTDGSGGDRRQFTHAINVVMPELPAEEPIAVIRRWQKRAGERIGQGETLVDVETDRVRAGVGAPMAGVVDRIIQPEGASIPFGQAIATIRNQTETDIFFDQVGDARLEYDLESPLTMSPTENLLVGAARRRSGSSKGQRIGLLLYRLPEVEQVGALPKSGSGDCAFSRDGQFLAQAGGRAITIWNIPSGQRVASLTLPGLSIWAPMRLAFDSPQRLFASYGDRKVVRWDVHAQSFRHLTTPNYKARLAVRPDGRTLITASDHIDFWDGETGERIGSLGHAGNQGGTSMALNSDGKLVALGTKDKSVQVWDIDAGTMVQRFSVPGVPDALSFSPDGLLLAISTLGGSVSVRELSGGNECFSKYALPTQFAGFTRDGRHLVVVAQDHMTLWTNQ